MREGIGGIRPSDRRPHESGMRQIEAVAQVAARDDSGAEIGAPAAAGPRPLRVLLACDHIDHDGALHGAGRQIVETARAFDPERVRARILVLREASDLGRALQRALEEEGLPLRFLGHGRFNPASLGSLLGEMRAGTDLAHVTDFGASTFGRLAGRIAAVPVVVHIRSHHSEHQPRGFPPYVEWAYRALAPLAARGIAISRSVADFATERMGFPPERVEILNNPLAGFSFSPPPEREVAALRDAYGVGAGEPVVGSVTRFHAAKGIEHLIDAFALLQRSLPDARLILVGEGPLHDELVERARERKVADRVVFAGFRRDVEAHYAMFDVTAVPSIEEGFGNVAVESMAMGTPVVASDIGGLRESVEQGESGLRVPPADPRALADALFRLLEDEALRTRMGRAARRRSRRFSMDAYVERLERLYRSVLEEWDGKRRART